MDRREFLKKTAYTGAGLTLGSLARLPVDPATAATNGCRWGAYAKPMRGQSPMGAIHSLEDKINRKLSVSRHYINWDTRMPGTLDQWLAKRGTTPYISWNATHSGGGAVKWSSIASGGHNRWIRAQARRMKSFGRNVYLAFHHEPENDGRNGGAPAFRSAYERIHQIFEDEGAHNVTWVVVLTASTFAGYSRHPGKWMPKHFDLVGVDGYNRWPCVPNPSKHEWQSFKELFAPAHQFARRRNKGLFVGEYGCVEKDSCGHKGDRRAKAHWFENAKETIISWPELRAVCYSHTIAKYGGYTERFWVNTSKQSLDSFRWVGHLSYFR